VKSGRAVAFPIYRGSFGRSIGNQRRRPDFGTAEYLDNTIYTVKDLRRTIDYLQTRTDIDPDAIAFFGYSWGGVNGPVALAQEPRLRIGIIKIGLLPPMNATPEVDPVHALPRVRVPTLLFSGEWKAPWLLSRLEERIGTPAFDELLTHYMVEDVRTTRQLLTRLAEIAGPETEAWFREELGR
jgi:dienelactone hydrolase